MLRARRLFFGQSTIDARDRDKYVPHIESHSNMPKCHSDITSALVSRAVLKDIYHAMQPESQDHVNPFQRHSSAESPGPPVHWHRQDQLFPNGALSDRSSTVDRWPCPARPCPNHLSACTLRFSPRWSRQSPYPSTCPHSCPSTYLPLHSERPCPRPLYCPALLRPATRHTHPDNG